MARTHIWTDKLLEQLEDGAIEWETVARECIARMTESEIEDMCDDCDFLPTETEEEDYDS